ncbi:MAG: hypothetical protein IJ202_09135 [Bacteroidales bacterium]|nr:hypothetical protein [Bacteroidales bacterium]
MRKSFRIAATAIALFAAGTARVSAQKASEWFLPDISSSTYIIEDYRTDTGKFSTHPLSAITASFGRGTSFEFTASYDIIKSKFMGLEGYLKIHPALNIRAGIQRMPFLHETTYSPRILEAVGFSQGASLLGGYSGDITGINSRSRDCGILLEGVLIYEGERAVLRYWAGVFNGNGYSFSDNNRAKDFQGKILFAPWKSISFTLGVMKAKYSPIGEDGKADGDLLLRRDRITAGIWGDWGRWYLRGENIFGWTGDSRNECAFLMGGYRPTENTAIGARMDYSNADIGSSTPSDIMKPQICFTHFLKGNALSYRLQYGRTIFSDPDKEGYGTVSLCAIFRFGLSLRKDT